MSQSNNANERKIDRSRIIQMPVYSPEEVIQMIETVSVDPKVKDELTAIIRRSAKLSEQRAALSLSITAICGYSSEARGMTFEDEDRGYVVPEGISYDKSQNRYRTSYKEGKRLVQKVFSIRAHGERKALCMAVEQRKQWIREGRIPIKMSAKSEPKLEPAVKTEYASTRGDTTGVADEEVQGGEAYRTPYPAAETEAYAADKATTELYKSQTGTLEMNSGTIAGSETDLFSSNSAYLNASVREEAGAPVSSASTDQSANDMAYILNAFGTTEAAQAESAQTLQNAQNLQYLTQMQNLGPLAAGPFY